MTSADLQEHAFIALGANLPSASAGDPVATLNAAVERLHSLAAGPLAVSSWWESDPIDCPPGSPRYVNGMVALRPQPDVSPLELLLALQAIEYDFGRRRSGIVNEARVLDLDLIAWGQRRVHTPQLVLPHPRAHERAFVLAPLAELAPVLILPGQQHSVTELLGRLADQGLQRL